MAAHDTIPLDERMRDCLREFQALIEQEAEVIATTPSRKERAARLKAISNRLKQLNGRMMKRQPDLEQPTTK
jgi:hypothetical protein